MAAGRGCASLRWVLLALAAATALLVSAGWQPLLYTVFGELPANAMLVGLVGQSRPPASAQSVIVLRARTDWIPIPKAIFVFRDAEGAEVSRRNLSEQESRLLWAMSTRSK